VKDKEQKMPKTNKKKNMVKMTNKGSAHKHIKYRKNHYRLVEE
jgi:hypothetical protein